MADKQHRLAIQGELHRPERTGQGDPNDLSFAYLEDGQYYQDTDTGSLWRYDEADSAWYLLLDYDKESQKLKNVNTLNAFQNNVGKTTASIGATGGNVGTVTSIPAYTYAQLREGEEIVVIDSSNDLNYIFFTVIKFIFFIIYFTSIFNPFFMLRMFFSVNRYLTIFPFVC